MKELVRLRRVRGSQALTQAVLTAVSSQDTLMQLAKAVASAAAALVLKAKSVAQRTEDSGLQNQVIAAATQCALSTSQLVACTKVSPQSCSWLSHTHKKFHFVLLALFPIPVTAVDTRDIVPNASPYLSPS